ncbi:MAG TPA: gluconate:H+ symporter [Steroidobacteraceae bacterium]|nr:gluconate:H+ symporter [Steroidobacteraceae bacterium]
MAGGDLRLVLAAVAGIALAIVLIVRGRLHPFVALLCGAFAIGPLGGLSMMDTAKAVQKGAGDILGGTGLIVALGLALASMLQLSDGAAGLARLMIGDAELRRAPWMSLLVALVIGLPLFFETGLVLLLPIIASAVAAVPDTQRRDARKLELMLAALAGLSVVHALVPPHPGPLIAIGALGANLGLTIAYGLIVAVPTAILAGPVFARFAARRASLAAVVPVAPVFEGKAVPVWRALLVVLLPVGLIVAGQIEALLPPDLAPRVAWLSVASNPVLALLLACLLALPLLFGRRMGKREVQQAIWLETMQPAGAILLAIGAGGALKQVLVSTGFAELLARLAKSGSWSPILLGWSIAVAVRLATGSATVATITAAGIMPGAIAASGASPEWTVLAIGAGSVFFSHVNDPGFWLVKSYVGTDTPATFRTWSVLETIISVVGLALVFLLRQVL